MRHAYAKGDMAPLAAALLERIRQHPDDANACLDCSIALQLSGERTLGLRMQAEALALNTLYHLPAQRPGPGLRLLVIAGPGDLMANTPFDFLLEHSDVAVDLLFLCADQPWPEQVPDHDVLFVAVAESEQNRILLRDLALLCADWPRPVVNRPEAIARLSRDGACALLDGIAGLQMPPTVRVGRHALDALLASHARPTLLLPGADFPLIIRPLGSHAGRQLARIGCHAELASYLEQVDADQFYLAPFVDYRSADGQYRKYRVVLIDGQAQLCHCAISSHWMIHYLNAGMDDSADKRADEALAMAHFATGFARRHQAALRAIDTRAGLPYLGLDCAETADGRLLIFEIDNAMIVHAMDPPARYPYKQPVMAQVFVAFRAMLEARRRLEAATLPAA